MATPADDEAGPTPPLTYGRRYGQRWRQCFLVFAAFGAIVIVIEHWSAMEWTAPKVSVLVLDAFVGGVADGLLFGSLVCLIVAIPRSGRDHVA